MKRVATTCASLLLVAFLICSVVPTAFAQQAGSAVIEGVISIKFEESASAALESAVNARGVVAQKDVQGVPLTGIASVDQLNRQFEVVRMKRLFRPAGRFEARHRAFGLHRWYEIEFAEGLAARTVAGVRDAVEAFAADPNVTIAEPRHEIELNDGYEPGVEPVRVHEPAVAPTSVPSTATNDPFFSQQWHYDNTGQDPPGGTPDADIDLPEAYTIETGDPSVIVSVHDQGIDFDHEDLAANMWVNGGEIPGNGLDDDDNGFVDDVYGYNFGLDQGGITPGNHGTHVAGTVGAVSNNGIGVAGVAGGDGSPNSGIRLMSTQIFPGATGASLVESFTYAADMGAVISQNSWGYTEPDVFDQIILDAIDYFIANAGTAPGAPMLGGIVVFSSGNDGVNDEYYPGFYEPTIAVAATDHNDEVTPYSTYGPWVDVSAPGGFGGTALNEDDIFSTVNGGYGYNAGTSMACPHVSGTVALIVSAYPGRTNEQVRQLLEFTTEDIYGVNPGFEGLLGTGRISAFRALDGLDPDDDSPPGTITDLAASVASGGNSVALTWTAPADDAGDAASGPATLYRIAYTASGPIEDAAGFEGATLVPGVPVPAEPGTEQNIVVQGLEFEKRYWFAVRAEDDNFNTALSNSPTAATNPAPELAYAPDTLAVEMEVDEQAVVPLELSNEGPPNSELLFTFPAFAALDLLSQPGIEKNDTSRLLADASYPKGEDPYGGIGHPVMLGAGGPDAFGYTWIDSNEPGGPIYDWFDISDLGTEVHLDDDFDGPMTSIEVTLPFAFAFYGEEHTSVRIDHNGFLFFEGEAGTYFANQPLPDSDTPNGIIAPFWDDLEPFGVGSSIYHYYDEDRARFIVQWDAIAGYIGEPGDYTFQVILNDDGSVLFQYEDVEDAVFRENASIGIENPAGDTGLQVAFNTEYVENGLAVAIAAPPPFITDVSPSSGVIAAGQSLPVNVTFDSSDLDGPGVFERNLVLKTNDPAVPHVSILSELDTATGPAEIAVRPSAIDLGGLFVGATRTAAFYLVNEGGEALEVTALQVDNEAFEVDVAPSPEPSPLPFVVPVGDSLRVNVFFTPAVVGTETATVTIESDDADDPSVTVALEGEGLPAPVLAIGPDALAETLEVGQTATDTLTISNEGEGVLKFDVLFQRTPGEELRREMVAASPTDGTADLDDEVSAALRAEAPVDIATVRPAASTSGSARTLGPMDAVYQVDDGTAEAALGLANHFGVHDIMWLNAFEVVEYAGTLTSISTTWGPSTPAGMTGRVLVYGDPDDDGNPNNAVLLSQTEITVQDPDNTTFTTVSIDPIAVEGIFFVAVLLEDISTDVNPVSMDTNSGYQGASWLVGAGEGEEFDIENLSANALPPWYGRGILGLPNWLLRADSDARFVTVSPDRATVLPGGEQQVTVTYDATDLDAGTYEGEVVILANDPASLVVNVPTALTVTAPVATEDEALPTSFALEQNYPNPFAGQTTIAYALPEAAPVTLTVYDVMGRHVATLLDEEDRPAGTHEVAWDARGLASGVYVYRIQAGGYTETRRMALVR